MKRVLIVEDELSIRESLVDLFAAPDVTVSEASSLEAAKTAIFKEPHFDLIITDLRLGGHRDGGLQVMAAAGLVTSLTPVIVLTAFPDDDNKHASERLGCSYFLQKPVDLAVISALAAKHGVNSAISASEPTA